MAKKDFGNVNTSPVYDHIKNITAEPAQLEGGRRINLGLDPTLYDYVKVMAGLQNKTTTAFISDVLRSNMEKHQDVYDKIVAYRNEL